MAALILRSRRVVQPQGPVGVDFANPLTHGLFAASAGLGDAYGFVPFVGTTSVVDSSGFALRAGYSGTSLNRPVTSAEWTIISRFSASGTTEFRAVISLFGGSDARISQMSRGFPSGNFGCDARPYATDDNTTFTLDANRVYTLVNVISSSRNVIEYYVDGALVRSAGLSTPAEITLSELDIFRKKVDESLFVDFAHDGSTLGFFAAFSRALPRVEVQELSGDPWQLFRPIQRSILVPSAASGWVDIPGATSASYTTPALALGDSGAQYRLMATNAAGSVTSSAATLTVT